MIGLSRKMRARLSQTCLPGARLPKDRRGVVAVEFAIVGPLLMVLLLGIVEISLLGWTQAVLQLTASQTARCVGLGSTACNNPTEFAVNLASSWLYADAVTAADVTLQTDVACAGAPGHYARVVITSQFPGAALLPGIFSGGQLSARACYFTGV